MVKVKEPEDRFAKVKEHHTKTLEKALNEKKVDKQLISLLRFVSSTKNYFTSSGCSGRILLLKVSENEKKQEAAFHSRWHRAVSLEELWKALQRKSKGELWLKQEPFILHVGCKGLEESRKLLNIAQKTGIKRTGIIVAKEGKFLVEFIGTQHMSLPVKKGDEVLVEKDYLRYLLNRANKKLLRNYALLKKFEKNCKKELK